MSQVSGDEQPRAVDQIRVWDCFLSFFFFFSFFNLSQGNCLRIPTKVQNRSSTLRASSRQREILYNLSIITQTSCVWSLTDPFCQELAPAEQC